MMIPITLRSTEEFLHAVPRALREGSMALGAKQVAHDHVRGRARGDIAAS